MPSDSESKIVFVKTEEWEGLYVDGDIISEGHSVSIEDLVDHLGGEVVELTKEQDKILIRDGRLPRFIHQFEAKYRKRK